MSVVKKKNNTQREREADIPGKKFSGGKVLSPAVLVYGNMLSKT